MYFDFERIEGILAPDEMAEVSLHDINEYKFLIEKVRRGVYKDTN
jgi:hypothetical protein